MQDYLGRIWEFETANFRVIADAYYDWDVDLSFDTTGEVRRKLESGEFTSFFTEVTVTHQPTGIELAAEHLGGSIYEDYRNFRDHFGMNQKGHGSYFSQMVREALKNARQNLNKLCGSGCKLTEEN